MRGVVVIGEGEKDDAPMLFNGEQVGDGQGPEFDVAVDPIDGTTLMAKGMPNAIAVLAVAERGAMFDPSAVFYMEKLAVGPDCRRRHRHQRAASRRTSAASPRSRRVASPTSPSASSTGPGTPSWSSEVRRTGARIRFITDGDIAGAISAAREGTGVDVLMGIGGTPEGDRRRRARSSAWAGRSRPSCGRRTTRNGEKALDAGHDLDRVLHTDDLVRGDNVFFFATGVTDGDLLSGVRYRAGGAYTQSIVMRSKSGTIRVIDSFHRLEKLRSYSSWTSTCPTSSLRPSHHCRRTAAGGSPAARGVLVIRAVSARRRVPARTGSRAGARSRR